MIAEPVATLEGGFSRRVLRWVIGIAVASFLAALVLSGIGGNLESRETAGASSFSYSAIGHRALVEMLSALGLGVVSRRSQGGGGLGPQTPLVLAEPALEDGPPELRERITAARNEAGKAQAVLVLVLPKWRGEPGDRRPGWVGAVGLRPEEETTAALENLGEGELAELRIVRAGEAERRTCTARGAEGPRSFTFEADFPQLAAASAALKPVVTCNGLLLVGRRKLLPPGPEVLVITDPDVLNNQGLARGDHAALMEWIFLEQLEARGALFDETIHGFSRSRGLLAEAFRFPLLPASLQALLLTGIVLWAGMGRIGKPLPAPRALAAGKDVLIDNTATLLTSGGHVADSLARYHRQTVQAVAGALFLPADLPADVLQRRLQDVSEHRGIRIDLAAIERRVPALDDGRDAAARALDIARRLHRWRREMTHGQRNS
ncbi:MAG TPA: hypothetical protein DD490_32335 [Acidobacteria bacterium]|nr:hypothetical protein [Acidobacteriota bacterium]